METMEKHYDFITAEPAMQALWREKGTYAFDKAPPGESRSFHKKMQEKEKDAII